jgi:hypothetical protein
MNKQILYVQTAEPDLLDVQIGSSSDSTVTHSPQSWLYVLAFIHQPVVFAVLVMKMFVTPFFHNFTKFKK